MSGPAILFAVAVAWGVAYGLLAPRLAMGLSRAAAKTVPVALMALAAWLAGLPPMLAVALALSAAGDWFLAFEGRRAFLAGLVAFAAAHLAYAALFAAGQDEAWTAGPVFLAGAILVFAYSLGMFHRLRPHLGAMRIPAAVYCGFIAAMAVAAWSRGPEPVLLAGVALFLASDTILAFEAFVFAPGSKNRRWSAPAVWFAYLAAQTLILAAFLFD